MSLTGVVLQLAYRLRRHLHLGWSLARWLGLLLVASDLLAGLGWWPRLWPAALLGALFLGYTAILAWAGRRGYVLFRAVPQPGTLFHRATPAPPLRAEELVPVRASGWFTVEGRNQYYVDLDADFETVETREHIILGRVYPSRFLLLGRWPPWELGWWYIFFQPAMIRDMSAGYLHFGPRPHLALRLVYAPDDKTRQTIYLACDDTSALRRVWDDLLRDAPPETY